VPNNTATLFTIVKEVEPTMGHGWPIARGSPLFYTSEMSLMQTDDVAVCNRTAQLYEIKYEIIQQKDNLTNFSPYNPVVREISTDFKPFHITTKIVLSLTVTIISYINVRGIKYIGV
jgi:hypothetical protein